VGQDSKHLKKFDSRVSENPKHSEIELPENVIAALHARVEQLKKRDRKNPQIDSLSNFGYDLEVSNDLRELDMSNARMKRVHVRRHSFDKRECLKDLHYRMLGYKTSASDQINSDDDVSYMSLSKLHYFHNKKRRSVGSLLGDMSPRKRESLQKTLSAQYVSST
jgi:hypothetical protein